MIGAVSSQASFRTFHSQLLDDGVVLSLGEGGPVGLGLGLGLDVRVIGAVPFTASSLTTAWY